MNKLFTAWRQKIIWISTIFKAVSVSTHFIYNVSIRRLPARRDLFWEDYARSSSRKKVTWIEMIITPKIMAYFWQFSFCIHKNIQVFIWKRTVSIFTDHWGAIKKKLLTLIISKLRLARRSALSTFLREANELLIQLRHVQLESNVWKKWTMVHMG